MWHGDTLMKELVSSSILVELGVSKATIWRKTSRGEWAYEIPERKGQRFQPEKMIVVSTLPPDIQIAYQQHKLKQSQINSAASDPEPDGSGSSQSGERGLSDRLSALQAALLRFPMDERDGWLREIERLGKLIEKYDSIDPKRSFNPTTKKYEFVASINDICEEARCTEALILAREPRRAQRPSPYTLDGWLRSYRKIGLLAFVRMTPELKAETDKRKAKISEAAAEWMNQNWRNFRSPRALYQALEKKAKKERWTIPSETWLYRKWESLPKPVKTLHLKGEKEFMSKYAMYLPRDYSDLDALQILCGDHSQRDVFVLLKDNSIARPWLTLWLDLRTYLMWGFHLDLIPSSYTVGAAYANGVRTFGAQPLSRPEEGYYSYWYTDQGKDYKSHNFDGSITVHKQAFNLEGGIEIVRVAREVGYLHDLDIQRILARGYNAREKAVERVHRDISGWEENTFDEYCGRNTVDRPDTWRKMYADHQQFLRGKRAESPFIGFEEYREALTGFIQEWNSRAHERTVLGGARLVPLEEFHRLYTTRYEIAEEALALLLMKSEKRTIRKNGVRCTGTPAHWNYYHPAMTEFKGQDVEVRYSHDDYSHVWVILPNNQICEAELITPTSVLNPNKQTLKQVAEASARERKLIRDHQLLNFSMLRGETTEDRVVAQIEEEEVIEAVAAEAGGQARVQKITRMDAPKLRSVKARSVTVEQVAAVEADESIFDTPQRKGRVLMPWEEE